MPAAIFDQKMFGYRQDAWHREGIVGQDKIGAVEALEAVGSYEVTLEDLFTKDGLQVPNRAIIRHPMKDGDDPVTYGVVGPDYVLFSPRDVAELWDLSVQAHVETLGALGKGETLFISTSLEPIDVRGDEIKNYLLLVSPMSGFEALQARVTATRVVCQNTLLMAKQNSTETYKVIHDKGAALKLQAALDGVMSRATGRVAKFKELFELMADRRVTSDEVTSFIEAVYVLPKMPDVDGLPENIVESRMSTYSMNLNYYVQRREMALASFSGAGAGQDTRAAKGTLFGLYNAISEVESHSRGSSRNLMQNLLSGSRGQSIEKASVEAVRILK